MDENNIELVSECCECCDRPVERCGEREPYHEDADHWEPEFEDC